MILAAFHCYTWNILNFYGCLQNLTALHVKCQMLQVILCKNVTIIDLKLQLHQQYLWAGKLPEADLGPDSCGSARAAPTLTRGTDHSCVVSHYSAWRGATTTTRNPSD